MGKKLTTESFIEKAKQVHGDKYDYSNVKYVGANNKVCITCPKHGNFYQIAAGHLRGQNCPICRNEKFSLIHKSTKENFIKKAKEIHGDKYDYSKVDYIDAKTKVCIICPEHGEFWQTPNSHLVGHGCFECGLYSCKPKGLSTDEFVEKAKLIHANKYDYSRVDYINTHTNVCIICHKHGEFWQRPNSHLSGKGCPMCNESHLERDIRLLLDNNHVLYEYRKKNFNWLNGLELDFFLPAHNIAIECQGEQHFVPKSFGGDKYIKFNKQIELDKLKNKLCFKNDVKLIYYSYKNLVPKDWTDYEVITNLESLLDILHINNSCETE